MEAVNLCRLTDQDKDEIIQAAKQVCRWYGWHSLQMVRGLGDLEKLKKLIEEKTGLELEEYT